MIRLFLKKKLWAICAACVVGIISVLPQFLAPLAIGDQYKGIQFLYLDDEDIYRARIHEILDGYPMVAAPMVFEYKHTVGLMPPVNEFVYAIPAFIFGLSAVTTGSKFLLPALLFFLIYLLVKRILGNRANAQLAGITAGLLVTLGYDLIDYHFVIATIMTGNQNAHFLVWTRLVNPIIGAITFFSFTLSLWCLIEKQFRYAFIVSGILLASTVGYFFSFGLALCVLLSLALICLCAREYKKLQALAGVFVVAIICTSPYWYSMLSAVGGTDGRAVSERNGMYFTHAPVLNKVLLITSLIVLLSFLFDRYFKKSNIDEKQSWQLIASLLIGSWIAFNEQVITGREIWYHHFVQYMIPISLISLVLVLVLVWQKYFPRITRLCLWAICLLSLAWGAAASFSSVHQMDNFAHMQRYASIFSMLNSSPKDCVVLIKEKNQEELERLIPAYTHCNVYSTTSTFFGITKDRILHNYFLRLRLNGISAKDFPAYLDAHEEDISAYFFKNWDQMFNRGDNSAWLNEEKKRLIPLYGEFTKGNLRDQILKYRMDYLFTQNFIGTSTLSELNGLKLETNIAGYNIYSFK